ncbi:kinase-like protein [Mycena pura]|uniref:non-specific serine/threonine protein kinase n=1 Tax=Mycena pura TaxID=153505 RepID=A0AAD6VRP7_9AGAR|nr:kinase-like protein [Mycena pura]
MSTPWTKRKARLCALLKTTSDEDEDEAGIALDRILHGQLVIGKTAKTAEIDALRFQNADLQLIGTLERGQFGLIDVVKCQLDGRMYVRKSIEKRFAFRNREQCFPQFERDILLLARKTKSVWAPHLLCAFQTPTHLAIVMHYGEGGSLWDVLESSPLNGRVTEEDMGWWTPQVISAIHWCHSQGFAHRDIKPHNFVLTSDAHVLLIDFGSAAPLEGGRLPKRYCLVPCGTCDYISPEILNAHEQALVALEMENSRADDEPYGYGFETDWWSLGAMLYEMVYGVAPFFATDIRKTYLRIMDHEKSLRFDSSIPVSAVFQDLLRSFLTHADRRLGRRGISEILGHPAFVEIDWNTLSTETAPPGLHLPQFTYAEPSAGPQPMEEESHSQAFAFSALFQSSPGTSAGISRSVHVTPRRGSLSLPQDDAFIGFSWGPPADAFSELLGDTSQTPARPSLSPLSRTATPLPVSVRLSVPLITPHLRMHLSPVALTPAPHSYPFLTPMRPSVGMMPGHQTLPRVSSASARRTAGGRPVSDREAMKQLAECVGMSARKRVLESGRKPHVLTSISSHKNKALRFPPLPPAITVPHFASSQGRLRPAAVAVVPGSAEETTESESEGPPSPSPTPRPGSAMSVLSRRSGTPTMTGTYSGRSGVLGGGSVSLSLPRALSRSRSRSSGRDAEGSDPDTTPAASPASPTFEDRTFDELEDKHAAIMEDILLLEDRLDRFSHLLIGRSR